MIELHLAIKNVHIVIIWILERIFYNLNKEKMDYKKLIIEMLDKLENKTYLEYIYKLIKTFLD